MSSKYIKKYSIPQGFQSLLSEFTKEILRNQPKDIVDFAVEYFKCLQQGLILDYPDRGQNIPCDFKPAVPKIPPQLKHQNIYEETKEPIKKEKKKEEIKVEEKKEEKKEEIKVGEKKEEIKVEEKKEEEIKVEEKKEEEKEEKKEEIQVEEKKEEEKEEKEEKKEEIKIEEKKEEEKEEKNIQEEKEKMTQTVSSYKSKNNLYLNCIDFGEKSEVLSKLKENPEYQSEIEEYTKTLFEPNQSINDLVSLIQKTIISYYEKKGTEKESEYDQLKQEVDIKINEIKDKIPLLGLNFDTMDMKDAVNEFKQYDYYERVLKVYTYKLGHLNEENNELLDEICFFIFANNLKALTTDEKNIVKLLEDRPYIERYFLNNFRLLLPEVYSFILGIKHYDEPEMINLFSSFSFRKRELCHKYFIFYNIKKMGRSEKKKAESLEKYLFISSPVQLIEKMEQANEENKMEVFDSVTDKLQQNFSLIWQFISRVINIPIELINSSVDIFMGFNTISRNLILDYLKLNEDYKDIYNILSEVKIDAAESNFSSQMDTIYFEMKYIPELNFKNSCIYRNKLFTIPDSIKDFISKFENDEWKSQEENLLKEYETKNSLNIKGIYTYLLIKNMSDNNLNDFLKKLKLIKEKVESELQVKISEGLKESFTLDSDEFLFFKKEYEKWKNNLEEHILDYFKKENDEQKKEYFMSLKDDPDKILLFNVIKIDNNLTENEDFANILEDYKQNVPGKNN
jgi:hypothetical protein